MQRRELLQKIAAAAAITAVSREAFEATALAQAPSAGPGMTGQQAGETSKFLPGFTVSKVKTTGTTIHVVKGGQGPPLLLLHGAPMSHITWRFIGPLLAKQYTVVAPDLRGYGDSGKMPDTADHSNYSKRAMALDQVEVMKHFGFEKFPVIGQDRGGRVTHRMCLDHADTVTHAAVLDIIPTYYLYTHVDIQFVQAYFHWFNYLRAAPGPEDELKASTAAQKARATSEIQLEYLRTSSTPENIHAMCEDYRAGASIDLKHDEADLQKKLTCPLRVLWAEKGPMGRIYDVLKIWNERGTKVSGRSLPGGHNLQEDVPDMVLEEILALIKA